MIVNDLIEINGKWCPAEIEVPDEEMTEIIIPPEAEIEQLKQQLSETDYKAIKYAEGWYSYEEYAPIKAERQALRERINELEEKNEC